MEYGVKFYGESDLSNGLQLQEAEKIIVSFNGDDAFDDINKVLELYNIKQFFDKGIYF